MKLRDFIYKIHLWLGLVSGLVVFFVSITGCILVFNEDIHQLFETGVYRSIERQNADYLTPVEIEQILHQYHEGPVESMNATVFYDEKWATVAWVEGEHHDYTAYILNPYTGSVIDSFAYGSNFWAVVTQIHVNLGIPVVGKHIVAASTFIFFILLCTGLVLWFPGRSHSKKRLFKIRLKASPQQLTYDLHNVVGFYATWILIFVVITGLAMSYSWVDKAIYNLAHNEKEGIDVNPENNGQNLFMQETQDVDNTFQEIMKRYDHVNEYFVLFPDDSQENYRFYIQTEKGKNYNRNDGYTINGKTGKLIRFALWMDKNNGDVLRAMNLPIHDGSILGFPGKLLAFFASLIAASLPVTGFILWLKRRKRRRSLIKMIDVN